MGADGGAGRSTAGAVRPPQRHEGHRPWRWRLGDDRRVRAGQAWLHRLDPRGARPGRRRQLDDPPRHHAHRARLGREAGLRFRRGPVPERRPVAAAALAHRRARLLQRAGRAARRSSSTRPKRPTSTTRATNIGPLAEQARAAARGEGGSDRLHLRAARQGRGQERARSAVERRGQGEVRHVPRHRGLPRLGGPRLQEDQRARSRGPARLPRAAAVRASAIGFDR